MIRRLMDTGADQTEEVRESLRERCRQFGLAVTPDEIAQMASLDGRVAAWSRAVRLTGFPTAKARLDRYFVEALHAAGWVPREGGAVDIGSGGGSPALPMAIVRREMRWTLLEPNRRKAVFLEEAAAALGLENVRVARVRLEDYEAPDEAQVVTSRGVALGARDLERIAGWLAHRGRLLWFTTPRRREELREVRGSSLRVAAEQPLAPSFRTELLVLERAG